MPDITLRPSQIYFLHDSIDCRFRDGTPLLKTFEELLYGEKSVSNIQIIAVFHWKGQWWIYAGHRRLFLYKRLEELGILAEITVRKVWKVNWEAVNKKMTTQNGGTSVEIRNDHNFDVKLRDVINKWRSSSKEDSTARRPSPHAAPVHHGINRLEWNRNRLEDAIQNPAPSNDEAVVENRKSTCPCTIL
ncbi:uncharacterized protein [Ptychodera flava]|uniref:uncharacterized protein n=1 Tax=Ptychodera flava TaxID=63121 RepID=UPI00396A0879